MNANSAEPENFLITIINARAAMGRDREREREEAVRDGGRQAEVEVEKVRQGGSWLIARQERQCRTPCRILNFEQQTTCAHVQRKNAKCRERERESSRGGRTAE